MLDTLHKALLVPCLSSIDELISVLVKEYEALSAKGLGTTYLNNVGMYKSNHAYSIKHLDQLYDKFGALDTECYEFAESLFDVDIANFDCVSIGKKLNHRIFGKIKNCVKSNLYRKLVTSPIMPDTIDSYSIAALIPGNFDACPIIYRNTFISLVKRGIGEIFPVDCSHGKLLAENLQKQIESIKNKYVNPIFPLDITNENLELLKFLTVLYLTDGYRNRDLQEFLDIWTAGGLLFFSCLFFSRTQEKESNRDFWKEYAKWLKFESESDNQFHQNRIYPKIEDFWRSQKIPYITSQNHNIQYVLSFRMHGIVANRPLSVALIIKFLLRTVNDSGTCFHDLEEQKELLERNLEEYSQPLIGDDSLKNSYLQLPRETAYAFIYSTAQVVDFLLPIYDYLERELIDKITDGLTFYSSNKGSVPAYLEPMIKKTLCEVSVEEVKKIRAVMKGQIRPAIVLSLNLTEKKFIITVPVYSFTNLGPNPNIHFQLLNADNEAIFQNDDMFAEFVGSTVLTKEFAIPCEHYYENITYQFSNDGKILAKGKVFKSPIFDMTGFPIRFPCHVEQPVLCLAESETIDADNLILKFPSILDGYNVWEAYLSTETPILIKSTLYGVGDNFGQARSGFILSPSIYKQVSYSRNKTCFSVIGEYPSFFLRLNATIPLETAVKLIIDGIPVPFCQVTRVLLEDGKGESYYRFKVDSTIPFPNGRLIQIRLFSVIDKKDIIEKTYFCLRNLHVKYSNEIYWGSDDVKVEQLEFDDKYTLFKKNYYTFPNSNQKYRLSLSNSFDNRLILHPPIVDIKSGNESLIGHDFWYEELCNKGDIQITLPQGISVLKFLTVDRKIENFSRVTHQLKRRGDVYRTEYLLQPPETDDDYVTLILFVADINNKRTHCPVSKIYYNVARKPEPKKEFFYMPTSPDFHLKNIQPGLKISLAYYCCRKRDYSVNIIGKNSKILVTGKLDEEGTFNYYQEKDLPTDVYHIRVIEKSTNRFNGKTTEKVVYSSQIEYKTHILETEKPQLTENNLQKIRISLDGRESVLKTIQVISAVKRTFRTGSNPTYDKFITLPSFYLEGDFVETKNSQFSARGYFCDKNGTRIDFDSYNPFCVCVKEAYKDGSFLFSIKDANELPLRVGEQSGFVNARKKPDRSERELEYSLFFGKIAN